MEEYNHLIQTKKEYKTQLKIIKEKIKNHPITKEKNVEKGLNILNKLSDEEYKFKNMLQDFEEYEDFGISDYRPDHMKKLTYYFKNNWVVILNFNLTDYHQNCETILLIIKDSNKYRYDLDCSNNYKNFCNEFVDKELINMFKPFFELNIDLFFDGM